VRALGLYGSRRGPDRYGKRWNIDIRGEIASPPKPLPAGVELIGASFLPHSADEIHPELRFVGAGILAMANSGPNTNGTNPLSLPTIASPT
jgi:hypothetical protein